MHQISPQVKLPQLFQFTLNTLQSTAFKALVLSALRVILLHSSEVLKYNWAKMSSLVYEDVLAPFFYKAFRFQKRVLKNKTSPVDLKVEDFANCGHRGSRFKHDCRHLSALRAQSHRHQRRDTSKHILSWSDLSGSSPLPISDEESWEQPHFWLTCLKWSVTRRMWSENAQVEASSIASPHRPRPCVTSVTGRTAWAGKANWRHMTFPFFWHQHLLLIQIIHFGCFCFTSLFSSWRPREQPPDVCHSFYTPPSLHIQSPARPSLKKSNSVWFYSTNTPS